MAALVSTMACACILPPSMTGISAADADPTDVHGPHNLLKNGSFDGMRRNSRSANMMTRATDRE
jgi:hypothetical protein